MPTVLESFLGAVLIQDPKRDFHKCVPPCIPSSEPTARSKWALGMGVTGAEFLGVTAGYLTKTQHSVTVWV